jgi:hypothetical protein
MLEINPVETGWADVDYIILEREAANPCGGVGILALDFLLH